MTQLLTVSCREPNYCNSLDFTSWNSRDACIYPYPSPFESCIGLDRFDIISNPCSDLWTTYCDSVAETNAVAENVREVNIKLNLINSQRNLAQTQFINELCVDMGVGVVAPFAVYIFLTWARCADRLSRCFYLTQEQQDQVTNTALTYNVNYNPAVSYRDALTAFKNALRSCKLRINLVKRFIYNEDVRALISTKVFAKHVFLPRTTIGDLVLQYADIQRYNYKTSAAILAAKGSEIFAPVAVAKNTSVVADSAAPASVAVAINSTAVGSAAAFEPMEIMVDPAPHAARELLLKPK